jgi:hypothetical protein
VFHLRNKDCFSCISNEIIELFPIHIFQAFLVIYDDGDIIDYWILRVGERERDSKQIHSHTFGMLLECSKELSRFLC